jgi:hypothetical protein
MPQLPSIGSALYGLSFAKSGCLSGGHTQLNVTGSSRSPFLINCSHKCGADPTKFVGYLRMIMPDERQTNLYHWSGTDELTLNYNGIQSVFFDTQNQGEYDHGF